MDRSRWTKLGVVVGACAVLGAAGGIVGSAAAPGSESNSGSKPGAEAGSKTRPFHRHGLQLGVGGPPVHSEAVVPNSDGDGFETVTSDSGKVKSVSGSKLSVTTGTDDADYKDVTIDVPGNAVISRNGRKAVLSALKAGDRVHVVQAPSRSVVMAQDAATAKKMRDRMRRFRPRDGDRMGPPPGPHPGMREFGGPPPMG
jgi:hypothetical protein